MLSPRLALNLWVRLLHNCHDYDLLGNNSPRLGVAGPGLSLPIHGLCGSRDVPRVLLWGAEGRWQLGVGRGG